MSIQFLSNCHTHTTFCDGKNTPSEMASAAYQLGFTSLGFSAHSPLAYENDWALSQNNLSNYIHAINALKEEYQGKMEIVLGIELDADTEMDLSPFEYAIGSLHTLHKNGEAFPVDASPAQLMQCRDRLFDGDFYALMQHYFESLYNFVKRQPFTVLGHFDLPLKYNKNGEYIDEYDPRYQKLALSALDGILDLRPDLIIEINTGGIPRAGRPYPYPAPFLIKHLTNRNAKLTLTSDAHRITGLNAEFDNVTKLLPTLGVTELYRLESGIFRPLSIV